jgi:hypothetical protein
MVTVPPPGKNIVSSLLVITLTDGGPNWRSTSPRGIPTGGKTGLAPTTNGPGRKGFETNGKPGWIGFAGKKIDDPGVTTGGGRNVCPGRRT